MQFPGLIVVAAAHGRETDLLSADCNQVHSKHLRCSFGATLRYKEKVLRLIELGIAIIQNYNLLSLNKNSGS